MQSAALLPRGGEAAFRLDPGATWVVRMCALGPPGELAYRGGGRLACLIRVRPAWLAEHPCAPLETACLIPFRQQSVLVMSGQDEAQRRGRPTAETGC